MAIVQYLPFVPKVAQVAGIHIKIVAIFKVVNANSNLSLYLYVVMHLCHFGIQVAQIEPYFTHQGIL